MSLPNGKHVDVFAPYGTHVLYDNGEVRWLSPKEIASPNLLKQLRAKAQAESQIYSDVTNWTFLFDRETVL